VLSTVDDVEAGHRQHLMHPSSNTTHTHTTYAHNHVMLCPFCSVLRWRPATALMCQWMSTHVDTPLPWVTSTHCVPSQAHSAPVPRCCYEAPAPYCLLPAGLSTVLCCPSLSAQTAVCHHLLPSPRAAQGQCWVAHQLAVSCQVGDVLVQRNTLLCCTGLHTAHTNCNTPSARQHQ
jgi:hypothetical protein